MEYKKIKNAPPTVYYFANFISEEEENQIMEKVNNAPKPKWTQLSKRRLQNWGGIPHPNGMIAETIPQWLQKYMDKIQFLGFFNDNNKLNHVLVNEYLSGQGIMSHLDGPLFYPTVSTISCGSHTFLNFYEPIDHTNSAVPISTDKNLERRKILTLLLERRSLVILQDDMYNRYLHGIDDVESDVINEDVVNLDCTGDKFTLGQILERDTRISLTIRHVPKTTKLKLSFMK